VAIKVLPPELAFRGEIRARFLREAETAAQLTHPNIVPIYAVDEKEGLVLFVMAFVDGENLATRIHKRGAMDAREARRVLRDVADALAYAHSHKVIHRDIKPDNILLDAQSGRPMVTDFGIARAISEGADARLTATGIAIGTPAYMSPEQSAGDKEIDGRSDLYSLGVVAYQMLSGELPFIAASTPAMLVKHLSEQPMPLHMKRAGLPPDLAAAVMCLLAKDPADRFPDAASLVQALDGNAPIPVPRAPAPRPAPAWSPLPEGPEGAPLPEELARWNAPVVDEFRRKLKPYIVVNAVLLFLGIFTGFDAFGGVMGIWSVYLAFKYAKVWSAGYDWRDVFRQPRDRLIFDVITEWIDDLKAWSDPEKRPEVRARWRARSLRPGLMTASLPASSAGGAKSGRGPMTEAELHAIGPARAESARRAIREHEELMQLVASLPPRERKQLKEIAETARALVERVRSLALALAELDRTAPAATDDVDREIAALEAQANPLDREASEARVRRLAMLKRDRRGLGERAKRRDELEAKLESCSLALQNLKYDVLRLKTGGSSASNVTLVAERAMSLAHDVDALISANAASGRKR
jgi:serine/threonine-protein kinase